MKPASCIFLALLFVTIFLVGDSTSARILPGSSSSVTSVPVIDEADDMANLMGSEECSGNDEGCIGRRMMADAHLDYIYTQHKPKAKGSP